MSQTCRILSSPKRKCYVEVHLSNQNTILRFCVWNTLWVQHQMSTHSVHLSSCAKTKTEGIKPWFYADKNSIIHISVVVELSFLENDWVYEIWRNDIVGNVTKFWKIWLASSILIAWLSKSLANIKFTRTPIKRSQKKSGNELSQSLAVPDWESQSETKTRTQTGTLTWTAKLENYPKQVSDNSIISTWKCLIVIKFSSNLILRQTAQDSSNQKNIRNFHFFLFGVLIWGNCQVDFVLKTSKTIKLLELHWSLFFGWYNNLFLRD